MRTASASRRLSSGSQVLATPIACGKICGLAGHDAGAHFLVDDRRYAEAGLRDEEPLDIVGQPGDLAGPEAGGPGRPGQVAESVSQDRTRSLGSEPIAFEQHE